MKKFLKIKKKEKNISAWTLLIYMVLILWGLTTVFPFVWVVLNSFKESSEVLTSSFSLPMHDALCRAIEDGDAVAAERAALALIEQAEADLKTRLSAG